MSKELNLTEGKVLPTLIKFAIPFLLANLLQSLYGAVDLLVVGQFAESAGVSAVATGSQIMQTITGIVIGLTTGGTVLIGQYIGAKKEKDAAETVGTMVILFAAVGIVFTLMMIILARPVSILMHAPAEALIQTVHYVFLCSCGIIFIVGYNMVSGILRGIGDSKTPLYFVLIACISNIIFDLVLVALFKMGAAGAAIATTLSQAISLVLAVIYLSRKGFKFKFTKKHIKFDKKKSMKVINLGMPIALQDALINVSFLVITVIVNSMGLVASAALGVTERIIVFAMLPPMAFSAAIATMTAQNIGAAKVERAKKCLKDGIIISFITGTVICILCQIVPETFAGVFSRDAEVIQSAALYLRSYSVDCIMVAFIFCFNGFFNGCGKSFFSMAHSIAAAFIFRIPVSFFFSHMAGVTMFHMGIASPLASFFSIICCTIYYKSRRYESFSIK